MPNLNPLLILLMAGTLMLGCAGEEAPINSEQTQPLTEPKVDLAEPEVDLAEPSNKSSSATDPKAADPQTTAMAPPKMAGMKPMDPKSIKFKDEIASNVAAPENLTELVFNDKDGNKIQLQDFKGKHNVVLVFTEGFNGALCPFCKTQTSRLVANYGKFQKLDTKILVVYPGTSSHLDEFVEAAKHGEKEQVDRLPFPIVLDADFAATNFFDIKSMHAHPSTFIIDKNLKVQFAYVGKDMTADRPSIKAMLSKIEGFSN